ncbi:glycosyltransferase family 4 protein [Alicyclobacillus herbarius]|uniref:glycosyltransferase family 4 protein n=1 Tax=Alicyclobacillus herbarius TaxID=122960 RepID=UPI000410ED71|nr:glycosyltransferase [Alicyclobacillus herbarius]
MRVVFAHDAVFDRDPKNGIYYNERFNFTLWRRYLEVFEQITVIGREREVSKSDSLVDSSISSGPNVSFAPAPSISGPVRMITSRPQARRIIMKALCEADALIARLPSELGLLSVSVARKLQKPYAIEVVGNAWDSLWHYGNWQGKVYAPILHYRMKRAVRMGQYVLYVTDKYLQECYPSAGITTNCSNVEIPSNSDEMEALIEFRTRSIEGQQPPIKVGIIAFMEAKYKGIDTALRALQLLRDQIDIELRILGGGNREPWVMMAKKLGLSDRVKFYGAFPPGEAVFRWLDDLDIYLQPSKTEGLPRALIEAMSRGLPAIGTNVGGIPELLPESCICGKNDYKGLAKLIQQVVLSKDLQRELCQVNIKKASQYSKTLLDARRKDFWKVFASSI